MTGLKGHMLTMLKLCLTVLYFKRTCYHIYESTYYSKSSTVQCHDQATGINKQWCQMHRLSAEIHIYIDKQKTSHVCVSIAHGQVYQVCIWFKITMNFHHDSWTPLGCTSII